MFSSGHLCGQWEISLRKSFVKSLTFSLLRDICGRLAGASALRVPHRSHADTAAGWPASMQAWPCRRARAAGRPAANLESEALHADGHGVPWLFPFDFSLRSVRNLCLGSFRDFPQSQCWTPLPMQIAKDQRHKSIIEIEP